MRGALVAFVLAIVALFVSVPALCATVTVVRFAGTVNPGSADYIDWAIKQATLSGSECLVIEMDTPGGLVASTRTIVQSILNAPLPVVVYVSPAGAHAGSAGVMITLAAHLAAMAPGTNIGAAHPVAAGGEKIDEELKKKITNDTIAFVKAIAQKRKRNVKWAIEAVEQSASVTASEAVKLGVVDLLADSTRELLEKIDGRTVQLDGREVVLKTKDAQIARLEPSIKHKLLM
ncbi:MAG TPA: nodulation protein NfeD, partial [Proteobacteria bacterium]|nr:nodulation protein NfeD [Pseudomonadota bacterium]